MNRRQINEYITKELDGWARGYSIEARLYQPDTDWDGQTISLTRMRMVAQPGETWFLDKWHSSKCYILDMRDITIPTRI